MIMNQDFRFNTPTLITLTAPTASGKSYLLERMVEKGFERIVSTTTRAPRNGEREGGDYHFISEEDSQRLEKNDEFAELVTFQGIRYGVTKTEFQTKMNSGRPPIIILNPDGLDQYSDLCASQGWNMFAVYIHVVEHERIERLNRRTIIDLSEIHDPSDLGYSAIDKLIRQHTKRIQGIMHDERSWSNTRIWDAIVPGDDADKAMDMVKQGIKYRNERLSCLNT